MEEFDVIVLGTGLKECILSGLVSTAGKKVLHLDRNPYYGGESASVNAETLFTKFRNGEEVPKSLGRINDYCVDLCPKFLMACGDLVKILVKTDVSNYLEFAGMSGSFVYNKGKVQKVPSTVKECVYSGMLSLMEKNRFRQFLQYVAQYDAKDPKTHQYGYKLETMTAADLFKKFKLSENCQQFTGHAIALFLDDEYLKGPATELVKRAQLYAWSVARYGNSPYIYPKYGLGGLPEAFSRRCAVHGGTFMLNMGKAEPFVEAIKYDDDGQVTGIELGDAVLKAYDLPHKFIKTKQLIADPSYFKDTDKVKKGGKIARCIAIMDHPIPNTNNVDSCQLIIPAKQAGRQSDVYICLTSSAQKIAAQGKYVAVMSTNMETEDPEKDLELALKLVGKIEEKFVWTSDVYTPTSDGTKDQCYIASSMDATTHFQTSTKEVLEMYERVIGEPLDLSAKKEEAAAQ